MCPYQSLYRRPGSGRLGILCSPNKALLSKSGTATALQETRSTAAGFTLKAVTGLSLLAHNIKHRVDQLGTLCVVALCPVVACSGLQAKMVRVSTFGAKTDLFSEITAIADLPKYEVVRPKDLAVRPRTDRVHGSRLQVHEDRAGHVAACNEDSRVPAIVVFFLKSCYMSTGSRGYWELLFQCRHVNRLCSPPEASLK